MKKAVKWGCVTTAILICALNVGSLIWNYEVQTQLAIVERGLANCKNSSCPIELLQQRALIEKSLQTRSWYVVALGKSTGQ